MADNPGAGTLTPYLQLVNSRCPEGICCCQHDGLALSLVVGGKLTDGGCLAYAIDTDY